MTRRDIFIFVPQPGGAVEAKAYPGDWLRSLDGHPGYLGGSVLEEMAGELIPDTLVMLLEFTRGNGLLARMLHIHAAVADEFSVAAAPVTAGAN